MAARCWPRRPTAGWRSRLRWKARPPPSPSGLARVMVGRAEIITPTMEWELMKQVVQYSQSSSEGKDQAVAGARAIGLGRFTEAAIRRLTSKMPSREFSQSAWNLLDAVAKPAEKKLALAK